MEPQIIIALLALVSAYFVYQAFFTREAIINRKVKNAPRVPTQDFPEGDTGKITGHLSYTGKPLRSPLTGRRCAYYRVIVEQYRNNGKTGYWSKLIEDEGGQDFLLKDKTGVALVKIDTAKVAVTKDAHFKSGTFNDATPTLERFLSKHGRKSTGWWFNKKLRYREGVLEAGEWVAVYGQGHWQRHPTVGTDRKTDEEAQARLVISDNARNRLYITDDAGSVRNPAPGVGQGRLKRRSS